MIISIVSISIISTLIFTIVIIIEINFNLKKILFKVMIRHDSCHHQFTELICSTRYVNIALSI